MSETVSDDLAGKVHWENVYSKHGAAHKRWKPWDYNSRCLERMFQDVLARQPVQSMLEIGCGDSTWLAYLAKKHSIATVAGLDYAPSGAEMARRRLFCQDMFTAVTSEVGQYDLV